MAEHWPLRHAAVRLSLRARAESEALPSLHAPSSARSKLPLLASSRRDPTGNVSAYSFLEGGGSRPWIAPPSRDSKLLRHRPIRDGRTRLGSGVRPALARRLLEFRGTDRQTVQTTRALA